MDIKKKYWYLLAPAEFWQLDIVTKKLICNGTGAVGTPKFITAGLDSLWGFAYNYKIASNIHDYMYWSGIIYADKIKADVYFGINLLILFGINTSRTILYLLTWKLNLFRIILYFICVSLFGFAAFTKNKQEK